MGAVAGGALTIIIRSVVASMIGYAYLLFPYPADMLWFVAFLYAMSAHTFILARDAIATRRQVRQAGGLAA